MLSFFDKEAVAMSLRRPDWLRELQSVLLVALAFTGVAVVVGIVAPIADGAVTFTVPVSALDPVTTGPLPPAVTVDGGTDLALRVAEPSVRQHILYALTGLPSHLLGLAMTVLLWRAVRIARRSEPFDPAVSRRLTVLGYVVAFGGMAADAVQIVASALGSATVLENG